MLLQDKNVCGLVKIMNSASPKIDLVVLSV